MLPLQKYLVFLIIRLGNSFIMWLKTMNMKFWNKLLQEYWKPFYQYILMLGIHQIWLCWPFFSFVSPQNQLPFPYWPSFLQRWFQLICILWIFWITIMEKISIEYYTYLIAPSKWLKMINLSSRHFWKQNY